MKKSNKIKEKDEIEQFIGYAVEEGYLDIERAGKMTDKEKEDYYERCMNYEPSED